MKRRLLSLSIATVLFSFGFSQSTVKIRNNYTEPLSVNIGVDENNKSETKAMPSNTQALFKYKLTSQNYGSTKIFFKYDINAFAIFLDDKLDKLKWKGAANNAIQLLGQSRRKGWLYEGARVADSLRKLKQNPLYEKAIKKWLSYDSLLNIIQDENKKKCLIASQHFIEESVQKELPSVGLEIDFYLFKVLNDIVYVIPISKQVELASQMTNQFDIGSFGSDYSFQNLSVKADKAPYSAKIPFALNFNHFIGTSSAYWPGSYLTAGYSQSTIKFKRGANPLFQDTIGLSYSHLSFGLGFFPNVNENSKKLLSTILEISYRLNFRKEYALKFADSTTTKFEKISSQSKGLESGNLAIAVGVAGGINDYMLKVKILYGFNGNAYDKKEAYTLKSYLSGSILFSIPLGKKLIYRYKQL